MAHRPALYRHNGRWNRLITNMCMRKHAIYKQRSLIRQSRYSQFALTKHCNSTTDFILGGFNITIGGLGKYSLSPRRKSNPWPSGTRRQGTKHSKMHVLFRTIIYLYSNMTVVWLLIGKPLFQLYCDRKCRIVMRKWSYCAEEWVYKII